MNLNLDILAGYKTYIAALGLIGLGIYQLSSGDLATGGHTLLTGLGMFGLRTAMDRNGAAPASPPSSPK